MKKVTIPLCFAAFLALGSCNGDQSSDTAAGTGSDSVSAMSDNSATGSTNAMTSDSSGNTNMGAAAADSSMGSGDQAFVTEAASGGLLEVELGKTVSTAAASAKVKEFGRMMVTDHTKANNELKAIAAKKSMTVPTAPIEKHQMHIDDIKSKKGAELDKAYVDMMVDDHKEDIETFTKEAQDGKDPQIKAFAAKTLPVLQKHMTSIKAIQAGMNK